MMVLFHHAEEHVTFMATALQASTAETLRGPVSITESDVTMFTL